MARPTTKLLASCCESSSPALSSNSAEEKGYCTVPCDKCISSSYSRHAFDKLQEVLSCRCFSCSCSRFIASGYRNGGKEGRIAKEAQGAFKDAKAVVKDTASDAQNALKNAVSK